MSNKAQIAAPIHVQSDQANPLLTRRGVNISTVASWKGDMDPAYKTAHIQTKDEFI